MSKRCVNKTTKIRDLGNTRKSRSWFFTFNNPKADMKKILEQFKIDYVYQLERGEKGTIHYQGVIRFPNPVCMKFQSKCPKEIHWEYCKSWRAAIKYCSKRESRLKGPYTNIVNLKYLKTIKDPLEGKKLYKFQKLVCDLVKTEPDDRKIYWFYDLVGNTGKTSLAKHLKLKYKNQMIYCSGSLKDVAFMISKRHEEKVDILIAIWDIPRSYENYVDYKAIEKVKDGMMFCSKYESNDLIFNAPHTMCFANFPPDLKMLSKDRWVITEISK